MKLVKNFIPYIVVIICSAFLLYVPYSSAYVLNGNKAKNVIKEIEKENENNELVIKNEYNDITYYLFNDGNNYKSYFFDNVEGNITDVYSIIKEDKINEFDDKINELLNLKYPKFVVDAINENSTKCYEIKENEMIIYYYDVNVTLESELYLTVNYNEIKDYLDITFKLDKTYENEDGYNYDPNKKSVALTFDDGPNGNKTLELLDILAENKAHATFFMIGNKMNYYSTVVTTVHNSGNEIGSHTYDHGNLKKTKIDKILEQEKLTAQIYYDLTGDTLKLTRPPYGSINSSVKEALDTVFITWDIDTEDWRYKDVEHIKSEILDNIKDGDIILLHDSYETSVSAIREVLPILYSEGYQVVSVSELAKLKGRTLEKNKIYRSIS
jgi:peptidoglycan/xylan/chitin deacetylase (PgdA/CDA1 family)